MELTETGDADWVAAGCTLLPAERPPRAAEFDCLFAEVHGISLAAPGRLRLDLRPGRRQAAMAAGLMQAETQCCSFFAFTLTATGGGLTLDVTVPPARAGLVDVLAARAAAVTGLPVTRPARPGTGR